MTAQTLLQALSSGLRKYGKALTTNLFVATKVSKLYGYEHQNFRSAIQELLDNLSFLLRNEGQTVLAVVNEFLVLNEITLKIDLGGYQSYRHVVDLYRDRSLGELTFQQGIDADEVVRLIRAFNEVKIDEEDPWASFHAGLEEANLPHIFASKLQVMSESDLEIDTDARDAAIETYFRTVAATQEAHEAFRGADAWNPKRLKRSAQMVVDLALAEENTILALTNFKQGDSREVRHATNTAILSAALGAKMGLPKQLLGDLAFASLLHDIGKMEQPPVRDESAWEPSEIRKQHPLEGARRLLLSGRISNAVVRGMNVAFLHHRNHDGSGFPDTSMPLEPSLLTRIVAVANTYDGLTEGPPYAPEPLLPAAALARVNELGGTLLDPLLVKVFVNLMGLFPVGSLVKLDSGELASVIRPHPKPEFLHRPFVRIFSTAQGDPCDLVVDLADEQDGQPVRSIVGSFQPEEIELELGEYLAVI